MKKNVGTVDRVTRIILAIILGFLYFNNTITGTAGMVGLILSIVLLLTSLVSFCPLYAIFGLSTCKTKEQKV